MTPHLPPKSIFSNLYKEGNHNHEIPRDRQLREQAELQFGDIPETQHTNEGGARTCFFWVMLIALPMS